PTVTPTAPLPTPTATSTTSHSSVYVGAADDALYALRASDGSVRWKYQATGYPLVAALGDGMVLATLSNDTHLIAVSTGNGARLWRSQVQACGEVLAASGTVYVSAIDAHSTTEAVVYALDERTGAIRWRAAVSPAQTYTNPGCPDFAVAGDALYSGW